MSEVIHHSKKLDIHDVKLTISCGIIIEKEGKILLQRGAGETNWSIPCGVMNPGEKYQEAARRSVLEETALTVENMQLFGVQSGRDCFIANRNGEKVFNHQIIFYATDFSGKFRIKDNSQCERRFYPKTSLPKNLNPLHKAFIVDWKNGKQIPIIN